MSTTSTESTTVTAPKFEVIPDTYKGYGFNVTRNGVILNDSAGSARNFATRNSARKRISRELRGDFHR